MHDAYSSQTTFCLRMRIEESIFHKNFSQHENNNSKEKEKICFLSSWNIWQHCVSKKKLATLIACQILKTIFFHSKQMMVNLCSKLAKEAVEVKSGTKKAALNLLAGFLLMYAQKNAGKAVTVQLSMSWNLMLKMAHMNA